MDPSLPAEPAPPPPAGPPPERKSALLFCGVLLVLVLPDILAQVESRKLGLAWSELFALLLPALWATSGSNLRAASWLGLGRPRALPLLLGALLGVAGFLAADGIMSLWVLALPGRVLAWFPDVARIFEGTAATRLLIAIEAGLLAPLCEEVVFRGYLQRTLQLRRGPAAAILLAALAFAARHLDPVRFPALILLGALFGWIAWRTGSIWPAVAAHAANNLFATAVALWLRPPAEGAPALPTVAEAMAPLVLGVGVAALLAFGLRWVCPAPPDAPAPRRDPGDPSIRFRTWLVARPLVLAAGVGVVLLCALVVTGAM